LLIFAGIGLTSVAFLPNSLIPLGLILAGFGLSGPQTLTNVLFAQVADEDELKSGVRREGAFFGVNALLTKPAQSIAIALTPIILEASHFVTRQSNQGEIFLNQPSSALFGIKVLIGLIPGLAMFLGALLLTLYPLRGEYLRRMQAKVLDLDPKQQAPPGNSYQDDQQSQAVPDSRAPVLDGIGFGSPDQNIADVNQSHGNQHIEDVLQSEKPDRSIGHGGAEILESSAG
jgi:Na+/melibiose symporter-like transporter